jgi:hypothetical protein
MLAALLLNLTGEGPPPPAVAQRFGGGPFWSRYGYGKWYRQERDEDDETSTHAQPVVEPAPEPAVQREAAPVVYRAADIDAERIAGRIRQQLPASLLEARASAKPKPVEQDDELAIVLLLSD